MLIAHKKSLVRSMVAVVLVVSSFVVDKEYHPEWIFVIRLFSCVFAYLSLGYMPNKKYEKDVTTKLDKMMSGTLRHFPKEFDKKDWHSVFGIPAFLIALGAGVLLSPSFCFSTEYGWADVFCELAGVFALCCWEGSFGSLSKLVDEEAESLFQKMNRN